MSNLIFMATVKQDGYFGDWQSALDEAFAKSREFNISIKVMYAGQYSFIITPDTTEEELTQMKSTTLVIGL